MFVQMIRTLTRAVARDLATSSSAVSNTAHYQVAIDRNPNCLSISRHPNRMASFSTQLKIVTSTLWLFISKMARCVFPFEKFQFSDVNIFVLCLVAPLFVQLRNGTCSFGQQCQLQRQRVAHGRLQPRPPERHADRRWCRCCRGKFTRQHSGNDFNTNSEKRVTNDGHLVI